MISRLNHITISVNDIEEAFSFYSEILGFAPIMKSETSAYFWAGNIWLAMVKRKRRILKPSSRYDHIAFEIPSEKYHGFVKKLNRLGITEWQKNSSEGESFYFLDPSFNKLEIHYSSLENRIAEGKRTWGTKVKWFDRASENDNKGRKKGRHLAF